MQFDDDPKQMVNEELLNHVRKAEKRACQNVDVKNFKWFLKNIKACSNLEQEVMPPHTSLP